MLDDPCLSSPTKPIKFQTVKPIDCLLHPSLAGSQEQFGQKRTIKEEIPRVSDDS
jgi:hypothetical protein